MSLKFACRTARQIVCRRRPYYAHLAVTHRCNLRCRFCRIAESPIEELDLCGLKRVVDRLDRLGVAMVSITGGEPLLHRDVIPLIDYASARGLYVKITSNGTMPRARYAQLLATPVREIAISLDGVEGDELPYAHVSPRILANLRFIHDRLPAGRRMNVSTTVSTANLDAIPALLAYCAREFPRCRVWLQPVVVGEGKLRVAGERQVDPRALSDLTSPVLVTLPFFRRACEEYFARTAYNWGCRAGETFLDVKPNGDVWMCQDQPFTPRLNVLAPGFEAAYRRADLSARRRCGGCVYSCYLLAQKSFEPRCWPQFATMWWFATTRPDDPWRQTARRYGWAAGLAHFGAARLAAKAGFIAKRAERSTVVGA